MENVAAAIARLDDLAASEQISMLAEAFSAAGQELAIVGGPVRDAFLGCPSHDLDFTTSATPEQILAIVTPIAPRTGTSGARSGRSAPGSAASRSRSRPTARTATTA